MRRSGGGRAARETGTLSLLFWGPIVSFPLVAIPLLFGADTSPPPQLLLLAGASSLSLFIAWAFYISALQRGETSPVVAIGSTYPPFALIIFFFSGSSVAPFALAGVLLVTLGLFLLHKPERGKISAHALFLGLGATGVWGFWGYFDYRALEWGNTWNLMLWTFLFALSLSLCFLVLSSFCGKEQSIFALDGEEFFIVSELAFLQPWPF